MAAYAWTLSALTWLHVNHLINGLHKQISWKNCLYADNLYFTLCVKTQLCDKLIMVVTGCVTKKSVQGIIKQVTCRADDS